MRGLSAASASLRMLSGISKTSRRRYTRFIAGTALAREACLPVSTEVKAVEETQDIVSMDKLMKVVRRTSNPALQTVMPMRSPVLWSEALLSATVPEESIQVEDSAPKDDPLPARSMADSYTELILPFGSSSEILEQYTNASGGIRTGKLMEHLDSLAGSISYKHMLPGVQTLGRIQDRGFYIVTASVDRLDVLARIDPKKDMRLSGQVIHTGRSSMEVAVKMESLGPSDAEETVMLGRFSMVCRDARTNRAKPVNPLVLSTPEEKALFNMGETVRNRRRSLALRSLKRVPPSSSEAEELHAFILAHEQPRSFNDNSIVWTGDTELDKNMLMFPQERNVHQKVFGGYLMRLAYELGFANASLFTRGHVRFLSLDGISFARPVPIGSILRLTSRILHSTTTNEFAALAHVGVQASVVDVESGKEFVTNDFRFTWCRDSGEPLPRTVVPRTYQEAMLWLEGKRALQMGAEIRGLRRQH